MREIICNACGFHMTKKEYEKFPECPDCGGHYVTEKEVYAIINGVKIQIRRLNEKGKLKILIWDYDGSTGKCGNHLAECEIDLSKENAGTRIDYDLVEGDCV